MLPGLNHFSTGAAAFFEAARFVEFAQRAKCPFEGFGGILADTFDKRRQRNARVAKQAPQTSGRDGSYGLADLFRYFLIDERRLPRLQPQPKPLLRADAPSHAGRMPQPCHAPHAFR